MTHRSNKESVFGYKIDQIFKQATSADLKQFWKKSFLNKNAGIRQPAIHFSGI